MQVAEALPSFKPDVNVITADGPNSASMVEFVQFLIVQSETEPAWKRKEEGRGGGKEKKSDM